MPKRSTPARAPVPPPASARSSAGAGWETFRGAGLIVVVGLLAYLPALKAGFIFDDDSFLTANPLIKAADGLRRFWLTKEAVDYWPLTSSTLWVEWRLWGLHAVGYHATNVALHLGECVLLWHLLRRLRVPGALLAALLFAVHPVNAESVVWITQRKNLMAMLFYLASIGFFLGTHLADPAAARWRSTLWYGASLAAFAFALLSKGSVAMLPFILLGVLAWRRPLTLRDALGLAPFFLVAAVFTVVDVRFAAHGPEDVIRTASAVERLLGAGAVVWFYLGKALLPVGLSFNYPQWSIQPGNPLWWLPLLAAVGVTAILARSADRRVRALFFAWGYFCVSLVPVMGFTDVYFMKYSLVSDHYQHLALIGVVALVAAAWSVGRTRARGAADLACGIVLAALTVLTWQQDRVYGDLETLYRTTLARNPDAWMAHNNLGSLLEDSGRMAEAIAQDEEALRLKPDFPGVHYNLGVALTSAGRLPEAVAQLEEALRLEPGYADAHINLAKLLHDAGRPAEAFAHLQQAVRSRPDDPEAHNDLGNMFDEAGRPAEAIAEYERAVALAPDSALTQANLGDALGRAGRLEEAIAHYRRGLVANPGDARLHRRLAGLLAQAGRWAEANTELEQAARPPGR